MHYLKKKKKKCVSTTGQCPLPMFFFFSYALHFWAADPQSDKVTLPSLLLIIQTLA